MTESNLLRLMKISDIDRKRVNKLVFHLFLQKKVDDKLTISSTHPQHTRPTGESSVTIKYNRKKFTVRRMTPNNTTSIFRQVVYYLGMHLYTPQNTSCSRRIKISKKKFKVWLIVQEKNRRVLQLEKKRNPEEKVYRYVRSYSPFI